MNHDTCRNALLEGWTDAEVRGHLAECAECSAFARRLQLVDLHAPSLVRASAPGDLADRVVGELGADHRPLGAGEQIATEPAELLPSASEEPAGTGLRRRRRVIAGMSIAAALAVIAGIVVTGGTPQQIGLVDEQGAPLPERTRVYHVEIEVLEQGEDGELEDRTYQQFVQVMNRKRVPEGLEYTIYRRTSDPDVPAWPTKQRWTDDGISHLTIWPDCEFEPPLVDVRKPLQIETYPPQDLTLSCAPDARYRYEKSVVGREALEAAGRRWDTWRMELRIEYDAGEGTTIIQGESWFAPELGDYVRAVATTESPKGTARRTSTLQEIRDEAPSPFDAQPQERRLGPDIVVAEGHDHGFPWEVYVYESTLGYCLGIRTGAGSGNTPAFQGEGRRSCGPSGPLSANWFFEPTEEEGVRTISPEGNDLLVYGWVDAEVDVVVVELEAGTTIRIQPFEGPQDLPISFYVQALPQGSRAVAVVALDHAGAEIDRRPHPRTWNRERTSDIRVVGSGVADGEVWELRAYEEDDGLCRSLLRGSEYGQHPPGTVVDNEGRWGSRSCGSRDPAEHDIWFPEGSSGSDHPSVWRLGEVSRDVARVRAVLRDRTDLEVEPFGHEAGFVVNFYLFTLPSDARLEMVIAYDAEGRELERALNVFGT